MTIFEAQRRMKQIMDGLDDEIINHIVPAVEPDIVKMQQDRLFSGKRSDGTDIEPEYKFVTTDIKLRKGQPTDRVTLKDTGDFYEGIFAETWDGKEVLIDSSDPKSGELKEKYGEGLFGITDDDSPELKEKSTGMLRKYVKEILFA